MHRQILAVAGLGLIMLAAAGPASAGGGEVQETVAARANARANAPYGPTNARDAELLERWGCLSGTRSAFCQPRAYRPYKRRRRRRR
jgi:hypothetical protein